MRDKLNGRVTGFRKSHGTQHSLAVMLETFKTTIDKGNVSHYLWTSQKPLIP